MTGCVAVTIHRWSRVECGQEATRTTVGLDGISRLFCDVHADMTIEAGATEGAPPRGDT